jgi:hypothetical protein
MQTEQPHQPAPVRWLIQNQKMILTDARKMLEGRSTRTYLMVGPMISGKPPNIHAEVAEVPVSPGVSLPVEHLYLIDMTACCSAVVCVLWLAEPEHGGPGLTRGAMVMRLPWADPQQADFEIEWIQSNLADPGHVRAYKAQIDRARGIPAPPPSSGAAAAEPLHSSADGSSATDGAAAGDDE